MSSTFAAGPRPGEMPACRWKLHEISDFTGTRGNAMTDFVPTSQVAADSTVRPEDVIEVLRQCFDPEIPVNIVDLGLIYDIAIKPERVDVKMTLTALGC